MSWAWHYGGEAIEKENRIHILHHTPVHTQTITIIFILYQASHDLGEV